jgi:hypothetical protein
MVLRRRSVDSSPLIAQHFTQASPMKTLLRLLLLACLGVLCGPAFAAERPNLILVTGDDMGFQLGCYGDTVATTPHMDRLARDGTRFTRGYITQASCSSSRS